MSTTHVPPNTPPAGPAPADPSPARPGVSGVDPRIVFTGGMGLILLVTGLIVWMVAANGGRLDPRSAYSALLYVGIALVTGIAFWTLTGSTGQVNLNVAWVGIRLGGGAAIGVAFMYIAHSFVAKDYPYVIVPLESSASVVRVKDFDRASITRRPDLIRDQREALVEFKDGMEKGWFTTEHPEPPGRIVYLKYLVSRMGLVGKKPELCEDSIGKGTNP